MSRHTSTLLRLPNIGPVTERWLNESGIFSEQDLRAVGAVAAYQRISLAGNLTTLNLLYALHGALEGVAWNQLSPDVRARLKREASARP